MSGAQPAPGNHGGPSRRPPLALAGLALVLGVGAACKERPQQEAPAAVAPAPAPDRVEPGQLLEGDQAVFGLALPESTKLLAVFRESASAEGPYAPEDLAVFLKSRLEVSHVEMAGTKILFPKARVKGNADRFLRVEILRAGTGSELRVRDVTPPPAEKGLSEEERWRKAGLTPSGQLLDPNGME